MRSWALLGLICFKLTPRNFGFPAFPFVYTAMFPPFFRLLAWIVVDDVEQPDEARPGFADLRRHMRSYSLPPSAALDTARLFVTMLTHQRLEGWFMFISQSLRLACFSGTFPYSSLGGFVCDTVVE